MRAPDKTNETINMILGRLRIAIAEGKKERQEKLLEILSNKIIDLGIKYPEIIYD